ncbi:hypothetical protein GOV05_03865, partial [Candidatus Woesearchaeota archaeon]|nr:hypothetical protein [Candidatus Woesearchaeota archaeon]
CGNVFNYDSCDDSNPCTYADQCSEGECLGILDAFCILIDNDGDGYTISQGDCDDDPNSLPVSGRYINSYVNEVCNNAVDDNCNGNIDEGCNCASNNDCDDGLFCTDNICDQGTCAFPQTNPRDSRDCTTDYCDETMDLFIHDTNGCQGCSFDWECFDGNPCTQNVCNRGICTSSNNDGATCNDNDLCTVSDFCRDGACLSGSSLICDDSRSCSQEVCITNLGCVYDMEECVCNNDLDCNDNDPCTIDECGPGTCTPPRIAQSGTPCNNWEYCDATDTCTVSGECRGTQISCDTEFSSCATDVICAEDTDSCVADLNNCQCSVDSDCDDGDICTDDVCGIEGICLNTYNTASCDDNDDCTESDACYEGVCAGETNIECVINTDPDSDDITCEDCDGDGIKDSWENIYCLGDCDEFADYDGDYCNNLQEYYHGTDPYKYDTNGDGVKDCDPCLEGQDQDGDGMCDTWEVIYDLNITDPTDAYEDPDGDGLINIDEYNYDTNPFMNDTDSDDLTDYEEVTDTQTIPTNPDTDEDRMLDGWEVLYGFDPLDLHDAYYDYDNDGLYNFEEFELITNPQRKDTDTDKILDGGERTSGTDPTNPQSTPLDSDGDGMGNSWEEKERLNPYDDSDREIDNDNEGLIAFKEYLYNTQLDREDSDNDGLSDYEEIYTHHTIPILADTDNDEWQDRFEVDAGTDPLNPKSFPDRFIDKDRDAIPVYSDCNDNDASINFAAHEICTDGVDNNCNGEVDCYDKACVLDTDCYCLEGTFRPCGTNTGVCEAGEQKCDDKTNLWDFIECDGSTEPSKEICDNDVDDDCDGELDCEDFDCSRNRKTCYCDDNTYRFCGSNVGVCEQGVQYCQATNIWDDCQGETKPLVEDCSNTLDDDCDGFVDCEDEDCYLTSLVCTETECDAGETILCGISVGVCEQGVRICEEGVLSECRNATMPFERDECDNGLDDDCDGEVDNGCDVFVKPPEEETPGKGEEPKGEPTTPKPPKDEPPTDDDEKTSTKTKVATGFLLTGLLFVAGGAAYLNLEAIQALMKLKKPISTRIPSRTPPMGPQAPIQRRPLSQAQRPRPIRKEDVELRKKASEKKQKERLNVLDRFEKEAEAPVKTDEFDLKPLEKREIKKPGITQQKPGRSGFDKLSEITEAKKEKDIFDELESTIGEITKNKPKEQKTLKEDELLKDKKEGLSELEKIEEDEKDELDKLIDEDEQKEAEQESKKEKVTDDKDDEEKKDEKKQ